MELERPKRLDRLPQLLLQDWRPRHCPSKNGKGRETDHILSHGGTFVLILLGCYLHPGPLIDHEQGKPLVH